MKPLSSILTATVLAIALAAPTVRASAATTPATEVTKSMQEAKQAAFELRKTAETLDAITRGGGHSWQSHSTYLTSARDDVNRLGKMLSNLEEMKPKATDAQQMGIARMRPQLVETANALTSAIELLNERRHNVQFPEYRQAVQTVSDQANSLHQGLDAVLDYESARARLDSLELLPSQSGS
jgi:uncharacterized phage infection (PIP) family protein YhgE